MLASREIQYTLTGLIRGRIGLCGHYVDRAQDDELLQRQLLSWGRVVQPSLTLRIIFVLVVDPITDVKAGQRGPMESWIILATNMSMFAESDLPFN